jgi:hypothetical protein
MKCMKHYCMWLILHACPWDWWLDLLASILAKNIHELYPPFHHSIVQFSALTATV